MSESYDPKQATGITQVFAIPARWLQRRLGSFVSRTTNQGLGAYLLFALSLTVCLIAGRLALMGGMEDREYVAALMKAEVQPQSDATRAVVLGLILAGLQDPKISSQLYCNGAEIGACATGTELWRTTQQLLDDAERQAFRDGEKSTGDISTTAANQSAEKKGGSDESWAQLIGENASQRRDLLRAGVLDERRDLRSDPCGETREIAARASVFYLASPHCTGTGASRVIEIVPQQAADALDNWRPATEAQPATAFPSGERRIRDYRILRARLDGQLFDAAINKMEAKLIASGEAKGRPNIAAAFFISVDSVIHYWTRTGVLRPNALPAHRMWASRSYFEPIVSEMNSSKSETTRAYMDYAGHGIVYTECHALTADPRSFPRRTSNRLDTYDVARSPSERDPFRMIVGAICVDYALSDEGVTDLVDKIDAGPVAKAEVLRFSKGPAGKWIYPPELPRWASSAESRKALDLAGETLSTHTSKRREILPLEFDGADASVFVVPLRTRMDGTLETILLRVSGVGPLGSRPEAMAVTTVFGAMALAGLFAVFGSSREVARREQMLGYLRSLQTAVVQTDGKDHITAANDRAEELVGRSLPTFGLTTRKYQRFWDLFAEGSILLDPGHFRPMVTQDDVARLRGIDADDIKLARRNGYTTTYYVRLLNPRTSVIDDGTLSSVWIRVTAGPILRPHSATYGPDQNPAKEGEVDPTFGVIEGVPHTLDIALHSHERDIKEKRRG